MSKFKPVDYAEALANQQNRPAKPRSALKTSQAGLTRTGSLRTSRASKAGATAKLRARPDPELAAWGRKVKKRDGNRCQWPHCGFCSQSTLQMIMDPHHKALRSARPDLRLVLSNGTTVCRPRHCWIHSPTGHDRAVKLGFLNPRTREMAAKEGTLGIR